MPKKTVEEDAILLAELSKVLLSKGITAITDLMALKMPVNYYDIYTSAKEKVFKQRTVLYYMWDHIENQSSIETEKLDREKAIHIGGIKLFSDGSVSGQTAWVSEPFVGTEDNCGIQTVTEKELLDAAEAAKQNSIQLVIHAMGEQAIDFIINTFAEFPAWLEDGPSIRLEHAALPTEKAIQRMAEEKIAVVTQPIFQFAEIESYINNIGLERTQKAYPIQSLLKAGVPVAFSSDAPATAWADPVNPFVTIQSAITRVACTDTGQQERVDVATAIELYTRAAQEITRIPNIGQLKEGYSADFIVLDQDILSIEANKIGEISVEQTYISGSLVYQKEVAEIS